MVRDVSGQLIETSSATYASEAEARRAADLTVVAETFAALARVSCPVLSNRLKVAAGPHVHGTFFGLCPLLPPIADIRRLGCDVR